jgi:hypothetical protein
MKRMKRSKRTKLKTKGEREKNIELKEAERKKERWKISEVIRNWKEEEGN